jgi:hypothetical protein
MRIFRKVGTTGCDIIAPSGYAVKPRTPVHGEEIKKQGREMPT